MGFHGGLEHGPVERFEDLHHRPVANSVCTHPDSSSTSSEMIRGATTCPGAVSNDGSGRRGRRRPGASREGRATGQARGDPPGGGSATRATAREASGSEHGAHCRAWSPSAKRHAAGPRFTHARAIFCEPGATLSWLRSRWARSPRGRPAACRRSDTSNLESDEDGLDETRDFHIPLHVISCDDITCTWSKSRTTASIGEKRHRGESTHESG